MSTSLPRRATAIKGDLHVYNDLSVGGIINARVVRGRDAFQGLYPTSLALNAACPNPVEGQWALVMIENRDSESLALGDVYYCETDNVWTPAGYQSDVAGLINQLLAEASAREIADQALNDLIDTFDSMFSNGYAFGGIAMKEYAPIDGQLFFLAVEPGLYPNYGNKTLPAGINILTRNYESQTWTLETLIEFDSAPTQNSNNLVTSGGVFADLDAAIGAEVENRNNAIAEAIGTEVENRNEAISEKDYAVITDEEMDEVLAEGEEDEE